MMGGDNKMEKMVFLKLKELNYLKKMNFDSHRIGTLLANKYNFDGTRNFYVGVKYGDLEEKDIKSST